MKKRTPAQSLAYRERARSAPAYRITKCVCPNCKGTGQGALGIECGYCRGVGKADRKTALHWADVTWTFAGGGYLAGDHNLAEMRAMEAQAKAVATLLGEPNRYRRTPTPWHTSQQTLTGMGRCPC